LNLSQVGRNTAPLEEGDTSVGGVHSLPPRERDWPIRTGSDRVAENRAGL